MKITDTSEATVCLEGLGALLYSDKLDLDPVAPGLDIAGSKHETGCQWEWLIRAKDTGQYKMALTPKKGNTSHGPRCNSRIYCYAERIRIREKIS